MSELNTFSEISNPTRLKILELKDCKISELAKKNGYNNSIIIKTC